MSSTGQVSARAQLHSGGVAGVSRGLDSRPRDHSRADLRTRPFYALLVSRGNEQDAAPAAAYQDALRRAVVAALARHPADSASVEEGRNDRYPEIWGIEIKAMRPGAASAYITLVGDDEVVIGFGETHAYLWHADPNALAEEVRQVLTAVFSGHLEESGMRSASRARVILANGDVWRGGSLGLPLPWRLRRRRRYLPLSNGS